MGGELAPTPAGYGALTRRTSKEICTAENGLLFGARPEKTQETDVGR